MSAMEAEAMGMAESDVGFVLDPSSGLYYHASSGFYYDAKADWYYNTQDGLYYLFKSGAYVPLSSTNSYDTALQDEAAADNGGAPLVSHKEEPQREERISAANADMTSSLATYQESCAHQEVGDTTTEDTIHSSWYSEWPSQGSGHVESVPEILKEASLGGLPQTEEHFSSLNAGMGVLANSTEDREDGVDGQHCVGEPEETRPASVWIEEALTELYLQNNPRTAEDPQAYMDGGSQYMYYQQDLGTEHVTENAYSYDRIESYAIDTLQDPQYQYRKQWQERMAWDVEAYSEHARNGNEHYESDDESEELEEGEWRPEEGKRENHDSADFDLELEEGEICEEDELHKGKDVELRGPLGVDGEAGTTFSEEEHADRRLSISDEEYNSNEHQDVAAGPDTFQSAETSRGSAEGRIDPSEVRIEEEERWRTQYFQATKSRRRSYNCSVDLWDWTAIKQEKNVAKKKAKRVLTRLVGRLAPNSAQVHPSLGGSGGFIRTTPICETDHEFVKVSSGRIYKLRRPSAKHLSTSPGYVMFNPTQDWGFPLISTEKEESENETGACLVDSPVNPTDAVVVSKAFVPNSGHWKYQPVEAKKRIRRPTLDPSLQTLTKEEIAEMEQRKQRYRDRAAERRTLHKGFGIGPGQKCVSVRELEVEEAEAATEMPAALAKAAVARPIGRDNIGKLMLEGMGWKEGQSLGPGEGGLTAPILALGNNGRTGLGWS